MNDYVYTDLRYIRYKPNAYEVDAFLGDDYVGSCVSRIAGNYTWYQQWKDDLVRCLATRCRTIILVTKCDCRKTIDLPKGYRDNEWREPIDPGSRVLAGTLHPAIEALAGNLRTFRFRNKFDSTGIRLFEEV